jgi:hypothetical protein
MNYQIIAKYKHVQYLIKDVIVLVKNIISVVNKS